MEDYSDHFKRSSLIAKYLKGELTDQERAELKAWIAQRDSNRALFEKLTGEDYFNREFARFATNNKAEAWKHIFAETQKQESVRPTYIGTRWIRYAVAAVFLMVFGFVIYQLIRKAEDRLPIAQSSLSVKPKPGTNKAVLTLADASQIILDDAHTGQIAKQEDMVITKTADGQLIYNVSKTPGPADLRYEPIYNTITTPRGGKYRIILPDGSKVWLNAASSLKYPTKFHQTERKVELSGEAYFEIARCIHGRKTVPFRVVSAGQLVEVLGTHFNINSYSDESSVKTTLLEGSVKVIRLHSDSQPATRSGRETVSLILKPGQQSQVIPGVKPKLNDVSAADLEEAVAWKNGQFQFRDTDLPTIMRQIARWYDVEVEFQGKIPDTKYRGKIARDVPLSQVFEILQSSGVNFKIDGRKITVKS